MAYGNGIEAKARGGEGVSATGQTEETGVREYLDKIRAGQPINYEAFLKRLPAAVRARQRRLFRSEPGSTEPLAGAGPRRGGLR